MGNENQICRVVSHNDKPVYSICIYYKDGNKDVVTYIWELTTRLNKLRDQEIVLHEWAYQFQRDLAFRLNIQVNVVVTQMTNRTKAFRNIFDDCKTMFRENFKELEDNK
jgi:hypothetical protein